MGRAMLRVGATIACVGWGFAGTNPRMVAQEAAADAVQASIDRGLDFLRESGQAEDGTFSVEAGPGLTALALTAAIRCGAPLDDPMVAKGLEALEGFLKEDGGVYGNGRLRNYETCVAILCFTEANADGRYDDLLAKAEEFVRGLQIGAHAGDPANPHTAASGTAGRSGRTCRTLVT
jgi:hypothetical protein